MDWLQNMRQCYKGIGADVPPLKAVETYGTPDFHWYCFSGNFEETVDVTPLKVVETCGTLLVLLQWQHWYCFNGIFEETVDVTPLKAVETCGILDFHWYCFNGNFEETVDVTPLKVVETCGILYQTSIGTASLASLRRLLM